MLLDYDEQKHQSTDVSQLKDEELLAASQKKPSAFSALVDRYEEAFLRKARRIVGEDVAPDVVQDVFVKIYLNAAKFRPVEGASFKSWGYKILVNTCFTYCKKMKRDKEFFARLDPELQELVADTKSRDHEKHVNAEEVTSVLARMPGILGNVLEDFFIKERTQQEIAEAQGVTVGVVRTRLHRAKKKFNEVRATLAVNSTPRG